MLNRLRSSLVENIDVLFGVEAAFVGLFFVQALRFLVGTMYARIASASLYPALNPALINPDLPGLVQPSTVSGEMTFLVYMLALPLLVLLLGRFRETMFVGLLMVSAGRYFMTAEDASISAVIASMITVGGGLFYITMLIRHRAKIFPYMFILALACDQILRARGNTVDFSLDRNYIAQVQPLLSVILLMISVMGLVIQRTLRNKNMQTASNSGLMPFWGGIGLGAILFLELSLLSMPNAIGARAAVDYTTFVPLVVVATLLPLIPYVREQARYFVGMFDATVRGWVWMLLIMLLLVFGLRTSGIGAGIALVAAQFMVSMIWWWLVRPQAQKERNLTGLWMLPTIFVFGLLIVFDIFTYEYAFVRDFAPEFDFLNPIIPPLLRGFRGMGIGVLLLAVLFATMPVIQTRRRIAWSSGSFLQTILSVVLVAGFGVLASFLARPPVIQGVVEPQSIRIGTYNIHAGFNEYYHNSLEDVALTIQQSGANIILLQEIEAGRLTSFGVDQPLWLARRLKMDVRFFPTNEGLQGVAVLSNIEIVFADGVLLDSVGTQTGLQRVQVRPDTGVITIYNTWLDPLLATSDNRDTNDVELSQHNQLSQIFGIIATLRQPDGGLGRTIFGGTFNNIPDSDLVRRMLDNRFVDHFAGTPLELSATFVRTDIMARLDYLWTTISDSFLVVSSGVIDTHASDHRMAVIEVALR